MGRRPYSHTVGGASLQPSWRGAGAGRGNEPVSREFLPRRQAVDLALRLMSPFLPIHRLNN
jgi:hypothetical protein